MHISIHLAAETEKVVIANLLQLYKYDFTEFDTEDVNEEGLFTYDYLDDYWVEPERFPFVIKVEEKYAGFALVRHIHGKSEDYYSVAEFFIMRKYRNLDVGKTVATHLFNQFQGKWEVAEMEENIPAQKFWRKVISAYTKGNFEEIRRPEWDGPIQFFYSTGGNEG